MVKAQNVTNSGGENPTLGKEAADTFKTLRNGKLPAALVMAGVAVAGGALIAEVVDDMTDPDVIVNIIEVF